MTQPKKWIRYAPWIASAIGVLAFVAVVLWVRSMIPDDSTKPKKMVQQITMITPPPPPPPPEVKPPEPEEPEIKEEEIAEETPDEPMPDAAEDAPAGEVLGVDAEGGAGGDAFGLVGRKGGRGLLAGGSGYAAKVQRAISDAITEDKKLRRLEYAAVLRLWIDDKGGIDRYDVDIASGDAEAKQYIELALSKIDALLDIPPKEMAQPIKLRIRSKL